ncbi:MAG: hypothetical protein NTV54_03875, partial [Ignavibacteriales bacterium]|nr:hypothetical protein [Ignavibacteriales bacterium]
MDAAELIGITPDRPDVEGGGAPHLYYYALAPSERLSVAVEDYKFSTDVPMPHRILRTYAIPFDTVASPPAFVSMAASDFPSQPTAVVTGYGWFRGYYVACIAIQPLFSQPGNSGLQFATILSLRIQKSAAHRNYSAQTVRKPDVQFEAILRNLILNYDTAVPYRTIIQNDSSAAWFNSANTYLKLAIPTDANYRLQKTQIDSLLPAMGHADPRTFQLFNRGKEIPIFVAGQNDGSFDPGDYLEFPGLRNYTNIHRIVTYQGEYNEYLNRYTDTSYYWLTYGSQNGIRCDSTTGAAIPSDTLRTYAAFLHLEKSTIVSSSQVDLTTQQDY